MGTRRRTAPGPSDAEQAFLASYDPRKFPPVGVTVDIAIFTIRAAELCVLLIRRGKHPSLGQWALPGGFVGAAEGLDEAAARELRRRPGSPPASTSSSCAPTAPRAGIPGCGSSR